MFEAEGKVIGIKRLSDGRLEHKDAIRGKFLGEEFSVTVKTIGGYRPDGTTYAEAQGSIEQGEVTIKYSLLGAATKDQDGTTKYRGVLCVSCPPGKLAYLNGIAILFEAELDDGGNIKGRGWEWR